MCTLFVDRKRILVGESGTVVSLLTSAASAHASTPLPPLAAFSEDGQGQGVVDPLPRRGGGEGGSQNVSLCDPRVPASPLPCLARHSNASGHKRLAVQRPVELAVHVAVCVGVPVREGVGVRLSVAVSVHRGVFVPVSVGVAVDVAVAVVVHTAVADAVGVAERVRGPVRDGVDVQVPVQVPEGVAENVAVAETVVVPDRVLVRDRVGEGE